MGFSKIRAENEARYVSEYVVNNYPHNLVKLRCPLGTAPDSFIKEMGLSKALRTYRPSRPEVDACIITNTNIVLIEGKIIKVMDGISKLIVYRDLVESTPELVAYKSLRVQPILITPKPPLWTKTIADKHDIKIEIFKPDWIKNYYEKQEMYWSAEERLKREGRKSTLKRLGYE
jgi:hypothetical protein